MRIERNSKIEDILDKVPTPCYVLEEELLEQNLKLLRYVKERSGAKIVLALKGYSLYESFPLVREYLDGCCCSGLYEARLSNEEFKKETHTYSPAFKEEEIDEIISLSTHISFNSFSQYERYKDRLKGTSAGIRVNPQLSFSSCNLYNPCAQNSRLGVTKQEFREELLDGIEGLHFHALCEENAGALQAVLNSFEEKFAKYIPKMKWINFGGGHHITRDDYDVDKLIEIIKNFKRKYNDIEVILEPGEAVGWQCGVLVASVVDKVHNGIDIAVLDTSAEAHMPDTIIMPYRADVRGAAKEGEKKYTVKLGGNSCLAGDFMGHYSFDKPLNIGDKVIFEDQIHYTIVKNTTFNGIKLPSIAILKKDGTLDIVKEFGYEDYKRRI